MKQMSFMLTTRQVRDGSKDVTRRNGWAKAKAGDVVMAIEKGQGLKKGEKVVKLRPIQFVSVRVEPLNRMTQEPSYGRVECLREGFPTLTPEAFVQLYCAANQCTPRKRVRRIQFRYL